MSRLAKLLKYISGNKVNKPDDIITNNIALLKIIGIWWEKDKDILGKIKFLLMITVTASVIVPETIYVWGTSGGFINKTRTMGPILGIGTFTMKYMILSTKRAEFKQFIEKLQDAYVETKQSKYWTLMKSANQKSQTIVKYYCLFLCMITVNGVWIAIFAMVYEKITGILLTTPSLPFQFDYGPDFENPLPIIWYTMLIVKLLWITIGVSGMDCSFVSLSIHIRTHFIILNNRMRSVGYKNKGNFDNVVRCNKCFVKSSKYVCEHDALEQLKICINQHNVVIKYVNDFESLYSWLLMVDFNLSAVKICLFLFQAIDNISETNQLIAFIGFAVGSWLQLYMISSFGQQIITESSNIADAAFGCALFAYGKTFRKLVILIMQRAQKPLGLRAGKFFYISMETFSKISSATISYFTLLRAVREK